ncbi:MAG TPA: hypothetical protein VMT18_14340 [Planctomycetota bacterium]|nr:hypothetical protein [Planctomycetota bacterium]
MPVVDDADHSDMCRVTVRFDRPPPDGVELTLQEIPTPDAARSEGLVRISFTAGGTTRIPMTSTEHVLEVPRGMYSHRLVRGEARLSWDRLDGTGPSATLEFDLPDVTRVTGDVASSLRGPIPDLTLTVASDRGRISTQVRTDPAGRFELDLPVRGPITVRPTWGEGWIHQRMDPRMDFLPPMDPSAPTASYVVAEALLRVAEMPPIPLLRGFEIEIQRRPDRGESSKGSWKFDLGVERAAELYLPPGTYVLQRRLGLDHEQSWEVTLTADEVRDFVLDSSEIAVIALDVFPSEFADRELRIRVRDTHGDIVDFHRVRRLKVGPYAYREVVEPGTYAVEVESHRKGARSTEKPLDAWTSEVTAHTGAPAPLRVFLR